MNRVKQIASLVLTGVMIISSTACSKKAAQQEILAVTEAFSKGVSTLDAEEILRNVDGMSGSAADTFRNNISLGNVPCLECDLKQAIADTITYRVEEDSIEIEKNTASIRVEFSIVDFESATAELTGSPDKFIDAVKSCTDTTDYLVTLELVKSDKTWLVDAESIKALEGLYSFINYEFHFFNKITDEIFIEALETVGIKESDITVYEDTYFYYKDKDSAFSVIVMASAKSYKGNEYFFARCVDVETAKKLFEYHYNSYDIEFEGPNFTGDCNYYVGKDTAYLIINGEHNDKFADVITPYHDAIFRKDNVVVIAKTNLNYPDAEIEVDEFLDAIGYPHP